jgi:hypothetical protein
VGSVWKCVSREDPTMILSVVHRIGHFLDTYSVWPGSVWPESLWNVCGNVFREKIDDDFVYGSSTRALLEDLYCVAGECVERVWECVSREDSTMSLCVARGIGHFLNTYSVWPGSVWKVCGIVLREKIRR